MDSALRHWIRLRDEGTPFTPKGLAYIGRGRALLAHFFNPINSLGEPYYRYSDPGIEIVAILPEHIQSGESLHMKPGDRGTQRFQRGNANEYYYFISENDWMTKMETISKYLGFLRFEYQKAKELLGMPIIANKRIGIVEKVEFVLNAKQDVLSSDTQKAFEEQGYYIALTVGNTDAGRFRSFRVRFTLDHSTFAILDEKQVA